MENTDKQTQYKSEKANNLKYSKTKLPWFSCRLQHSARKRGGLFLRPSEPIWLNWNHASGIQTFGPRSSWSAVRKLHWVEDFSARLQFYPRDAMLARVL